MQTSSLFAAGLAGLLGLAHSHSAHAGPPPPASSTIPVCGYVIELGISFGSTGTTSRVNASANLRPDGFSPPAPPPVSYTVYAAGWWRDATRPWDVAEDSHSGSASFPAQPAYSGNVAFKSGGCQLKGVATVVVTCPVGPPEVRTLERSWNNCEL